MINNYAKMDVKMISITRRKSLLLVTWSE